MIKIADVIRPRVEKVQPQDWPELPFIGLDDIEAHTMRLLGTKPASDLKSAAKRFYPGDVLYSRLRPYLNKVWCADRQGICSSEFIILPVNDYVDSKFLTFRLNAADFVAFANSLNAGDRPRVDFDQISSFFLPPFSLKRQRQIVAKIEALFSELDKGVESLKAAREQLKAYRQAVLKHAFEGKLTAQWREENKDKLESPEQLLTRIKKERETRYQQQFADWKAAFKEWETKGKKGKKPGKPSRYETLPPIDDDELAILPKLSPDWSYIRLAEIARIGSGMSVSKDRILEDPMEVPYLRVANVQRGALVLDEIRTMLIEKSKLRELALEKWDVLFNEGGDRDKLGRGWVWESQIEPCITQNHVFRATTYLGGEFHSKFVSHWGNTFGRDYFDKGGKQTTNLASINKTVLSMFPVPLPSLEEQRSIIRLLDDAMSVIDSFEKEIEKGIAKSEALRQSILKKAFSGQLVPQDPNDEPASVLLERIKAEKTAQAKGVKVARKPKTRCVAP